MGMPPVSAVLDAILAVAWAPRCTACDDPLERPTAGIVCDDCWRRIRCIEAPFCERCGVRVPAAASSLCGDCRATGGPLTARRAAGVHAGTLREIVHAFKYEGRRSLARPLAQLIRSVAGDWLRDADIAVPVPLHPLRRWRRGFNQADDLAVHLGMPVLRALRRRRHNRPAGHLVAHRAPGRARGRIRAGGAAPRALDRGRNPAPVRGDRGRRDHDRGDGGSMRGGAAKCRGTQRPGRQRSSGSRGSIAAAISAATTSGACSASMRTQSGCPAWRR